jgi:hypothetical protein
VVPSFASRVRTVVKNEPNRCVSSFFRVLIRIPFPSRYSEDEVMLVERFRFEFRNHIVIVECCMDHRLWNCCLIEYLEKMQETRWSGGDGTVKASNFARLAETSDFWVIFPKGLLRSNHVLKKNEGNASLRQCLDLQTFLCLFLAPKSSRRGTDLAKKRAKFLWKAKLEAFTVHTDRGAKNVRSGVKKLTL